MAPLILLSFYFTMLVPLFPFLGFLLQPFHSKSHSIPGCDSLESYNKPQLPEQGPAISVLPYGVPIWIHNPLACTSRNTTTNNMKCFDCYWIKTAVWWFIFFLYNRKKKVKLKRLTTLSLLKKIMFKSWKRRIEWKDIWLFQMHLYNLAAICITGKATRHG